MRKKVVRTVLATGTVVALGLTASCSSSGNPEGAVGTTVQLKVADWFPPDHALSRGIQAWMDDVTERTGGEIEFKYYPAEQLGKAPDLLSLTTAGTTDVSAIGFGYNSASLPLSEVGDLPGMHDTSCSGTQAYIDLLAEGGILDEEMRGRGLKALVVVSSSPYELLSTSRVESPDDVAGMKLRSPGGTIQRSITALEAAPVNLSGPEQYEALQRGTVDGTVFNYGSALSYSLEEVVKFATDGASMGSFSLAYSISTKQWDRLSSEVQSALLEAGRDASLAMCAENATEVAEFEEALTAKGGEVVRMTEKQQQQFEKQTAAAIEQWKKDDVPDPKTAQQVVDEFREAVAKAQD